MNVRELIEELESMDPNAEVKIAHQPSWPLECSIGQVVELDPMRVVRRSEFDEMSEEEQERIMDAEDKEQLVVLDDHVPEPEPMVFIGEGYGGGYLTSGVSRLLGWR